MSTQHKTLEEDGLALKKMTTESNARAEQLEQKWSEFSHKFAETKKELEALKARLY